MSLGLQFVWHYCAIWCMYMCAHTGCSAAEVLSEEEVLYRCVCVRGHWHPSHPGYHPRSSAGLLPCHKVMSCCVEHQIIRLLLCPGFCIATLFS